jgi:hypothetical protein
MQMKPFRFGPVALTNAAANLLNPGTITGGVNMGSGNVVILLRHLRIVNKTNAAHNYTLYIGGTGGSAAGTEFSGVAKNVPANDAVDHPMGGPGVRLDAADFLTGLADANTALVIQGEGEIGVA